MRVIVGRCGGRKLRAPPGKNTRPILDRVKQALFDRLGSRLGTPAALPPLNVLDIYAGPGSLGIEALSRGARFCCFVERDRAALECLRQNLEMLSLETVSTIFAADISRSIPPAPPSDGYVLVFLDPPYPDSRALGPGSPLARTLENLAGRAPLSADALVIWRFPADLLVTQPLLGRWRVAERHDYGGMSLAFLQRGPS